MLFRDGKLINGLLSPPLVSSGGSEGFNTHLNLFTERVDLLEQLSGLIPTSRNVSLYENDQGCPVLDIGLYSTLTMSTQDAFGSSFADEFSVLFQLRSSQEEDRSVLTLLNFYNHILLQIRIGPHSITFITTQQRDYEFSVSGLSDSQWHRISVGVAFEWLAVYVDCVLLEKVSWMYPYMGITTDGLLMVGGILEGFETPFESPLSSSAGPTADRPSSSNTDKTDRTHSVPALRPEPRESRGSRKGSDADTVSNGETKPVCKCGENEPQLENGDELLQSCCRIFLHGEADDELSSREPSAVTQRSCAETLGPCLIKNPVWESESLLLYSRNGSKACKSPGSSLDTYIALHFK
ncbi:hypothetical protein QQF64_028027 [Cirrhinus molitorella]|uniref:Thrombospondin-like N-terminal domain-containing protein n=1 Tax=Cirrhinus molitorella TaxID=172907 RepID=A0ABR3NER3_9TELE